MRNDAITVIHSQGVTNVGLFRTSVLLYNSLRCSIFTLTTVCWLIVHELHTPRSMAVRCQIVPNAAAMSPAERVLSPGISCFLRQPDAKCSPAGAIKTR